MLIAERGCCEVRTESDRSLILDPNLSVRLPEQHTSWIRRLTTQIPEGISLALADRPKGSREAVPEGAARLDSGGSLVVAPSTFLDILPTLRAQMDPDHPAAAEERTVEFVETVLRNSFSEGRSASDLSRPAAIRVRVLLVDHFKRHLTLAAVGRALSISPFYACHVFRRHFGLSIHQFLLELRVREAVNQIGTGSHNFADLADRLGFSSPSHFAATLKRWLGRSATEIARTFAPPIRR